MPRFALQQLVLLTMTIGSVALAGESPSETMRTGFPRAESIDDLPAEAVAETVQRLLRLPSPPHLGTALVLTPNQPQGPDGAHLSFWKPSFVIGTPNGGEAGINFWDIHNLGHINVGFNSAPGAQTLLDCRLYGTGDISYKIYLGHEETLGSQGESKISSGHVLLLVPKSTGSVSVELWPNPVNSLLGFLSCRLWPLVAI